MPKSQLSCQTCSQPAWERGESITTFFSKLLDTSDFPDRWNCGTWTLPVGCLHIVSDFLTFCAYFAIPAMIAVFLIRRRDSIPFPRVAGLFAAFIMLCGAGHLLEVVIFWWPVYRLAGLVKLATATVSVITAIVLYRLLPAALELPGISRVNTQLRQEIVQRTTAEQAAVLANSHKDAILSHTSSVSIIATDANGLITLFNRGAEQLLGFTADEAIGKLRSEQFLDLAEIRERCTEAGLPAPRCDQWLDTLVTLTNSPDGADRDWTYFTRQRERRVVTFVASPLIDQRGTLLGYLSVATDVTAQRAREHELRKLAIVARETINAVVIADRHRRIEWVNESFTRMTGYTLDEVRGRTPGHFLQGPDTNRQTVNAIREALDSGRVYQGEIYNYDKNKNGYWQALTITPVHSPDGEPEGFISVQTDITEIRNALDAADAANRAKSEFLANMSHEIRTPMTSILGFSEVLLDEIADPENHSMVEAIHRNGQHLLALINDTLDLSKIEAGHVNLRIESVAVAPTIQDVIDAFQIRARAKSLGLTLDVDADVPQEFRTDITRFRQILVNLIGNALKFTDAGGVAVHVHVQSDPHGSQRLAVDVRDTGIGIPADQHGKLFRPFQQLDGTATRKHGGTGLGLSICRRLAESLGGEILLQSSPGVGSCFTLVSGPLNGTTSDCASGDPAESRGGRHMQPLRGARILLVTAGSDGHRAALWILRRAGADVTTRDSALFAAAPPHTATHWDAVVIDSVAADHASLESLLSSPAVAAAKRCVVLVSPGNGNLRHAARGQDCDAILAWPITSARLLPLLVETTSQREPAATM